MISKLQVFVLWRSDLHIQAVVIYPMQTSCNSPSMISTSIAFLLLPCHYWKCRPQDLADLALQPCLNPNWHLTTSRRVPKGMSLPFLHSRRKSIMTSYVVLFVVPPRLKEWAISLAQILAQSALTHMLNCFLLSSRPSCTLLRSFLCRLSKETSWSRNMRMIHSIQI